MIYEVESCGGIYSMNDKCVVLNAKKMNFDGKLDLYVKRYIFVTVHWQYPAKRVAVNSNIFSYRHDIV